MNQMQKYFNIFLEFSRTNFNATVEKTITEKGKGYICVVDGNVLSNSVKHLSYREIINNALVNSCDGSSIALLAGKIHKQKFGTYTGPEIFKKFIKKECRQLFLGNTEEVLNNMQTQFIKEGINCKLMHFSTLPFLKVDEFNYPEIGRMINKFSPQIIWVSLGAPKQEIFIKNLLPHIQSGVVFAIGAAFNLYLSNFKNSKIKNWLQKAHLGWVFRVLKEPGRVGKRAWDYAILIPRMVIEEKKNLNHETVSSKC